MVRPRASDANLRAALVFSDVVTVAAEPGISSDGAKLTVTRQGRQSIFAAFSACFPNLARDSKEKRPENRLGVAAIELNKALKAQGLRPIRRRDRVGDSVRWRCKVRILRSA